MRAPTTNNFTVMELRLNWVILSRLTFFVSKMPEAYQLILWGETTLYNLTQRFISRVIREVRFSCPQVIVQDLQ
jgi:hypothetical protein